MTTPKVFDQAINDPKVSTINLSGTIEVDGVKSFDRPITIKGGELSFSSTGQNLVLLEGGKLEGVTIKNTSGSQKKRRSSSPAWTSTYGLQVYKGTAELIDCTFIGGNAGLLVNGSEVTLKGTTRISGMSFGGIEVSKGARVPNAGVLNIEGTLVNENEEYTKPTVWVDGTTEDIGIVNDSLSQLNLVEIKSQNQYYLNKDNTMKTWTDVATYTSETSSGEYDGQDVALKIDGQTFDNSSIELSQQQNRENPPKLHLFVKDSTFTGGTESGKHIYTTNCQEMVLENCEFKDNSVSDYGVDVNLCTIKDAEITIKGCKFTNTGIKSAIKISQRKGDTDHPDDITVTTPATIKFVKIDGCTFEGNVKDYTVGTTPKGEDVDANTTTGAYEATVTNCETDVKVAEPYLVGKDTPAPETTINAHETVTKTPEGSFHQD